jgi:hypothetical protein
MVLFNNKPIYYYFFNFRYVHAVKGYGTGYAHVKLVEKTLMLPITDRKYTIKQLLMIGTKRLKRKEFV